MSADRPREADWPSQWAVPIGLVAFVGAASVGASFAGNMAAAVIRGVAGVVVVAALLVGARRNRAKPRAAWLLLAFGIGAWVAGDALWDGLTVAGVPPASNWFDLPNALYLCTYPALFAAILGLVGARGRKRSLDNAIDCAVLAFAAALILRVFLVDADFTGTTVDNTFSAAFPFGDALLLGGVALLLFETGLRNPSAWLLAGGMALMLGTDVLWDLEVRFAAATSDAWVNPSYPVAYALVAAAALHPSVTGLTERAPPTRRHDHPARLVFLCASLAVVSFVAWSGSRHDILLQLCTVALVLVVLIRFAALVRTTERAFQKAETNERRFRLVATAAPVGIYEANADFEVVFANEESQELTGDSVVGMTPARMTAFAVDDRDRAAIRQAVDAVVAGRRATAEFRVRRTDGREQWIAWYGTPIHEGPGPFAGALASTVDITPIKDAEAALERQATHDPLTGLPNRRLLVERLSGALRRLGRRPGTAIALLFLDLDGFKQVNDEIGHDAGDELLKIVARRLVEAIREDDTVARFGGDEFVVILEGVVDRRDAATVAAKIIEAVGAPAHLTNGDATVGVSIGIATCVNHRYDPDVLLRDADMAMYRAKKSGRSRYRFFDPVDGIDDELAGTRPGELL